MRTILRKMGFAALLAMAGSLDALQPGPAGDGPPLSQWQAAPFWVPDAEAQASSKGAGRAVEAALPTTPMPFVAITPCRLADTRGNGFTGEFGPPSLSAGNPRDFTMTGSCGIPAEALAVSANLTVTETLGAGFILAQPTGGATATVSSLNYVANQTVANAAIVPLGTGGKATFIAGVSGAQLIIDVNGYYTPGGIVNSLNTLTGAVTLANGPNVTLTPSGNTLTIDTAGPGVTSLAGTNGISASPASGAVTVTSNATASNVPGTIVARDSFDGFSVGSINLTALLNLAQTTATTGIVNLNGNRFLHAYGTDNTFLGTRAGNTALTGFGNVGVGVDSLTANGSGTDNTAVGVSSLKSLTDGFYNTAVGNGAMLNGLHGAHNAAFGISALSGTNGNYNVAIGANAVGTATAGNENVGLGANTLNGFTSGSTNVAVGYHSGTGLVTGSLNIYLGPYVSPPVINESNTIRIGTANQTTAYIAGIRGVTTGQNNALPVVIDSNGQLGTVAGVPPGGPAGGGLSGTYPNPTVNSSTTNTGLTIVSRDVIGGFDAGTVKLAGSLYLPATDVAGIQGTVILNGARFLQARGTRNTFLGTNAGSTTLTLANAVDNTAVGSTALQSLTTGFSNTAVGSGALQAATHYNNNTAVGDHALAANYDGQYNVAVGSKTLQSNTSGSSNTAVGFNALQADGSGGTNTAVGSFALQANNGGAGNVAVGAQAFLALGSGAYNIGIGYFAGGSLTSGDDNIYIGNNGLATESSTIRIGTYPNQTAAYMAGVYGAAIGGSGLAVSVSSNGQLGTTSSSRRYKEGIADLGDESDVLMKLRPVSFYYRNDPDATRVRQYGLIAEEVAEAAPGLAVLGKDGLPETVRYHLVNAMLLNEVQKQRKTIEALEKRLAALEARR